MSANETVLYRDGNDTITATSASLGGKTYDLAGIKSVSLVAPVLRPEYGYGLAGLGVVLLLAGYFVWGVFLTPMLAGVVLIVGGIALATIVRPTYTLNLNATNGQASSVSFASRARAEQAVAALSKALSSKS